ncbi:hypothetical protein KFE25_003377 [Diacronema lutheri]|uniref:RNA helicase n=2 Tax=Diacronema lutheri TaxID=2081491 RepID=A0A8J5XPG5_DIALT|nr:hypothetical protein KFE25_003377 [Diacronema lutheri]
MVVGARLLVALSLWPALSPAFIWTPNAKHRASVRLRAGAGPALSLSDAPADVNALTTELNDAIGREDFAAAAALRDRIVASTGQASALDGWTALGAPDWLAERAERLGFRVPTPVQRRAFRALTEADTVIRSRTGSGKTLAYLMPILSALSAELLEEDMTSYLSTYLGGGGAGEQPRPRAELSIGDRDRKLAGPLVVIVVATRELGVQVSMLAYQLCGGNRNPIIQPFAHPRRFEPGAMTNMFKYTGPRHVRIAGVWDADSLNASMPVADYGLDALRGCHVVVGTPEYLAAVARRGHVPLHAARFTVIDEADACMRVERVPGSGDDAGARALADVLCRPDAAGGGSNTAAAAAASSPWRRGAPQRRALVGASITPREVGEAEARAWLSADATLIYEGGVLRGAERGGGGASGWADEQQQVPPGLVHTYVQVGEAEALGALVRLIRHELLLWEADEKRQREHGGEGDHADTPDARPTARPRPRIIAFCKDGATAVQVASPLQSTLWSGLGGDIDAGLCGLSVLLPSAEDRLEMRADDASVAKVQESSLRVMEMFAIESTNLLITTVGATRGLDFANVTHVFNLGIVGDATDYLHRAGRAGRIGHRTRGVVTSIVDADGARELRALGERLGFEPTQVELPLRSAFASAVEGSSKDEQVRFLEDVLQLYSRGAPSGSGGDEDRAA